MNMKDAMKYFPQLKCVMLSEQSCHPSTQEMKRRKITSLRLAWATQQDDVSKIYVPRMSKLLNYL